METRRALCNDCLMKRNQLPSRFRTGKKLNAFAEEHNLKVTKVEKRLKRLHGRGIDVTYGKGHGEDDWYLGLKPEK